MPSETLESHKDVVVVVGGGGGIWEGTVKQISQYSDFPKKVSPKNHKLLLFFYFTFII